MEFFFFQEQLQDLLEGIGGKGEITASVCDCSSLLWF